MIVAVEIVEELQINPKKISGLQRDSNPWPLRWRCSALPTEQ